MFKSVMALAALLGAGAACSATFHVEDGSLPSLPAKVADAIQASASYEDFRPLRCSLVGKKLPVGPRRGDAYVATTAGSCGWGAGAGPIWVVVGAHKIPKVVLASAGNSLEIGIPGKKGLADVATANGSAGRYLKRIWKFDGTRYVQSVEYAFSTDDPETCKAHPSHCPWRP